MAIHVDASRRPDGEIQLRFEVRDTGIGIDPCDQARIFDAFVQAAPDIAELFGGSGLVLAIVRRRIEARGGRIGVESTGKGLLFWLELAVGLDRAARSGTEPLAVARAARLASLSAGEGTQRREPVCVVAAEPFDALDLARRLPRVAPEGDSDWIAWAQRGAARSSALVSGSPTRWGRRRGEPPRLAGAHSSRRGQWRQSQDPRGDSHRGRPSRDERRGRPRGARPDAERAVRPDLLDLNLPKIGGLDAPPGYTGSACRIPFARRFWR